MANGTASKEWYKRNKRHVCANCGGEKDPGTGRRYCDECRELMTWKYKRRKLARASMMRAPCRRCNGRREPGHSPYCARCREERAAEANACQRCGNPKGRGEGRRLCDDCRPFAAAAKKPCIVCGGRKPPGRGRLYCDECQPTPLQIRERKAALARINVRLRAEQEGREVAPAPARVLGGFRDTSSGRRGSKDTYLDAGPIRAWLEAAAEVGLTRHELADRMKYNEKRLYELTTGFSPVVNLGVADRLLMAAGPVSVPGYGLVVDVDDLWPDVDRAVARTVARAGKKGRASTTDRMAA